MCAINGVGGGASFFNPDKCEWAIIGNKRSNIDFHLTLYGKKLMRTKYLKVLGLVIEGDKKDPFCRMEDIMKKRFRLVTRQLRTFIMDGTFHETKTLYYAIMISRSLYASEAWSAATYNVDMYGKIGKTYHKDKAGQSMFQQPSYVKTSQECYLKWFGTRRVAGDIVKLKEKKRIKSYQDIPLLPAQLAVLKDLALIFDIFDPKTYMRVEEFLEPLQTEQTRTTRSKLVTIMEKAVRDPTTNHQQRSLFRRHQGLLHWLSTAKYVGPLLEMKKGQRRKSLAELIGLLNTEENQIRQTIYQGNYIYEYGANRSGDVQPGDNK